MYAIDTAVQLSQIWIGIPQVPHNDTMLQTEPQDMSHVAWFPAYLQLDATEGTPIINIRLRVYPIAVKSNRTNVIL